MLLTKSSLSSWGLCNAILLFGQGLWAHSCSTPKPFKPIVKMKRLEMNQWMIMALKHKPAMSNSWARVSDWLQRFIDTENYDKIRAAFRSSPFIVARIFLNMLINKCFAVPTVSAVCFRLQCGAIKWESRSFSNLTAIILFQGWDESYPDGPPSWAKKWPLYVFILVDIFNVNKIYAAAISLY